MTPHEAAIVMSPDVWSNFLSLALGFAIAGALTHGYQAATAGHAGFAMLSQDARVKAAMSVPFIVFAAPFLIMRNILSDRTKHPSKALFVMLATVLAGFWSLMSGTALVAALQATGLLA
jgi:hypothetical protein